MFFMTRTRVVPAFIALTALLSACSAPAGAGPSADTATPGEVAGPSAVAPTASPTPTPVPDVAKLFAAKIVTAGPIGGGPISGLMTIGALEAPIAGTMALDGQDSSLELVIAMPGGPTLRNAQITKSGRTYVSANGGPWFDTTGDETSSDPNAFAQALGAAAVTAEDRGVVTKLGQQLHHLVPSSTTAITGAHLGMTDAAMKDAVGTLDFYARDDGSLAVLSFGLDWTIDAQGTPVEASMDIDFEFGTGPATTVAAPDDLWVRFVSDRLGYSIGHPDDWTVIEGETAEAADVVGVAEDQYSVIMKERRPKADSGDLDAYASAFLDAQEAAYGIKPETDDTVTILGEPARRLTYHELVDPTDANGGTVFTVYTLLIRGRDAYWIAFVGPTGAEDDVLTFHTAQTGTFELVKD